MLDNQFRFEHEAVQFRENDGAGDFFFLVVRGYFNSLSFSSRHIKIKIVAYEMIDFTNIRNK